MSLKCEIFQSSRAGLWQWGGKWLGCCTENKMDNIGNCTHAPNWHITEYLDLEGILIGINSSFWITHPDMGCLIGEVMHPVTTQGVRPGAGSKAITFSQHWVYQLNKLLEAIKVGGFSPSAAQVHKTRHFQMTQDTPPTRQTDQVRYKEHCCCAKSSFTHPVQNISINTIN